MYLGVKNSRYMSFKSNYADFMEILHYDEIVRVDGTCTREIKRHTLSWYARLLNAILNKSDTDFGKYILLMTMYSIWTENKTVVFCIEPIYQSIVLHNIWIRFNL